MPQTEEERRQKAIKFIEECGFASSECSCCGKTVDSLSLGQLMRCARCKMAYYCGMKCVQSHFEEHRADCLLAQQYGSFLDEADIKSAQDKVAATISRSKPKETKSFSGQIGQNKDKTDSLITPKKAALSFSAVPAKPKRSKSISRKKGKIGDKDNQGEVQDGSDVVNNRVEKASKILKKQKSNSDKPKCEDPAPGSPATLQGSSPTHETATSPAQHVWAQLHVDGEETSEVFKITKPTEISLDGWDVDDMKHAVKTIWGETIGRAPQIRVYRPGTSAPFSKADAVRPGMKLVELMGNLKQENPSKSIETDQYPLIVTMKRATDDAQSFGENKGVSEGTDGRNKNDESTLSHGTNQNPGSDNAKIGVKNKQRKLKRFKSADDLDRDLKDASKPVLRRGASGSQEPRPKAKRHGSKKDPMKSTHDGDKEERNYQLDNKNKAGETNDKPQKAMKSAPDGNKEEKNDQLDNKNEGGESNDKPQKEPAAKTPTRKGVLKSKSADDIDKKLKDVNTEPEEPAPKQRSDAVKRHKSIKKKNPNDSNAGDGKKEDQTSEAKTAKSRKNRLKRFNSADDLDQDTKALGKPSLRSSKSICEGQPSAPPSKSKSTGAGGSGGVIRTEEEEIQEAIRKLMENQGQCCYCEKKVPKHLMLHCARCKVAHYCKMDCIDKDFDLHRRICCFVADYQDYAPTSKIDR